MRLKFHINGADYLFTVEQAEKLIALIGDAERINSEYMTNPATGKYEHLKLLRHANVGENLNVGIMTNADYNAMKVFTKGIDEAKKQQ
jgi:hypothetical protein